MWTLGLMLTFGAAAAGPDGAPSLAVIRQAPDFTLINQSNQPVRLHDLRGQVLLVGFIFTTCNGSCPATTHRMCQVQEELKKRGLFGTKARLLSITLDPARDTAEVLRNYAQLYDCDQKGWDLLCGSPAQVAPVISSWGMWVRAAPNGQLDHPSRVFLVDRRGDIREIYNLSFLKPNWVADDIAALLRDAP
jgi:protein SCO1/2